ncbi:hypothetical protein [Streptomyces sp. NPDC048057]|uniref:hypothetical protein n=1 Tax=Streptomyces sp. NPDC048057 TaxID=3155628 RepID=UPI003406C9D8
MRRRTKWAALTGALLLTGSLASLASCAFDNGEPSDDEMRRYGSSSQARSNRADAERALRDRVAAFTKGTDLDLTLLRLQWSCGGGQRPELFDAQQDPYAFNCSMQAYAYYGTDTPVPTVLRKIDAAALGEWGTAPGGDGTVERALDYYRLKGVQGGVELGSPRLADPTVEVSWDDSLRGTTIQEPVMYCPDPPPPEDSGRCVNEPAGTTVAQLRERHDTVFQVHFRPESYFQVSWETHEKN